MKHNKTFLASILIVFLLGGMHGMAQTQNNVCENADPFCTGSVYNFPAGVNAGSGQPGPNYNCLMTTPNPAWYYMKIDDPGSIVIYMHSEPSKDIDFCCWGPFTSQDCCNDLTGAMVVDCSYSPAPTETCNIPNGQTGEYYMLVITNFSNSPCNIIFEQTGGTGTTDCTILPPPATNNSPICTGQTLQLSAEPVSNATYNWWGPDNFTSSQQNPTITNATPVNAGDYFLTISVNGQPSADTSVTTAFIYAPVADAGNDTTINNGVTTVLHGSCTAGSGSYSYHWEPADKLVDPNVQHPQTVNLFSTTIFTLEVTDDSASCTATDMVTISIAGGVLAVNGIATPSSICFGETSQLDAVGSGGAGTYSYEWNGPNGFSSNLPNPVVQPQETSTYTVSVCDGYNNASSNVTVTVIPLPVADAGTDESIPYGTYTFLSGSVIGGASNYFYAWSPADKLVNANVQNPQTINLEATTLYSLVVTDLVTNCVSNNTANVTIDVTGGALTANPVASPEWICKGDTTQLYASAGGGNVGFYEYTWSSDPPGFSSSEANPHVHPIVNTTYAVEVYDGFNTTTGATTVGIHPQPEVQIRPEDTITVCIFDSVYLDAGNAGATFLWNNGATTQVIGVATTGIGLDVQSYWVDVTNAEGCTTQGDITVIYSFEACVGLDEQVQPRIGIYPNPAKNEITINRSELPEAIAFQIRSVYGTLLRQLNIPPITQQSGTVTLDISDLPPGMVLINLISGSYQINQKLIINK
jgi:hypothetical protein